MNLGHAAIRVMSWPLGVEGHQRRLVGLTHRPGALRRAASGKVVLVTGASSGIGRAAAERLGRAGATVLLVARDQARLTEAKQAIEDGGGVARTYVCDLSDLEAIDPLVTRILDEHDHVDILVNNAGRSIRRKVKHSYERFHDVERQITLNYLAAVRLTVRLLPSMRERRSGHVINVSSSAVQGRPPRFSGYTASKAALEAWSDSVQAEVLGDGIRFTSIRMPLVDTPMITPTAEWADAPALSSTQAGRVIAHAVIGRPRRLSPVGGYVLEHLGVISPRLSDVLRSYGDRVLAESSQGRSS